jgi:hypothetical protein
MAERRLMMDVSSPPYPSYSSLAPTLLRHIVDFREWWEDHREQLQIITGPTPDIDFDAPTPLPADSAWDGVTVMDKARALTYLRNLREYWDAIIRDHEDAWESQMSVRRQVNILYMGRSFLNGVFLNPEEREAMYAKELAERRAQAENDEDDFPRFDDTSIELPDDFSIEDIVGENFDPESEDEGGEEAGDKESDAD